MSISIENMMINFRKPSEFSMLKNTFLHNPHVNGCAECVYGWTLR